MSDDQHVNINASVGMADKAEAMHIRGKQSWDFIYVALGFALTIEGNLIQMITPLACPWNILLYASAGSVTFWFFICNGRFQDWLFAMKKAYENHPR